MSVCMHPEAIRVNVRNLGRMRLGYKTEVAADGPDR